MMPGEVIVVLFDAAMAVDRAGHFRQRLRNDDERLFRRALHGRGVGRKQRGRPGAGLLRFIRNRIGHGVLPAVRAAVMVRQ
jgi:hypothetical protein